MNKQTTVAILAGLLVVVAAFVGWLTFDWYRQQTSGGPFGAPFTLTDHEGNQITEAAFQGIPSLLFFGFTHCPEVCPTTLYEMGGWLDTMRDDGAELKAYFVSVDPQRDTPQIMKDYVTSVSDRITGITGDPDKVAEMLKDFHVYARRVELDDGDYTMDHSASVFLLDRKGSFFGTISYGEDADSAVAKLRRLVHDG